MFAAAESGSTKTEWFIDQDAKPINTRGINPFFLQADEISSLLESSELNPYKDRIEKIFFFGPGCSYAEQRMIVLQGLAKYFSNAKSIEVGHDLEAAAKSVYDGQDCIAAILGTGSNSCFYDGGEVSQATPSLAFILGDEGSGNHMGKKLLRAFAYQQLPQDLHRALEAEYSLTVKNIMDHVYHMSEPPNTYLASFMPFIVENKDVPIIQEMIHSSFQAFFKNHISNYKNYKELPIHFVGSIAAVLKDELKTVAESFEAKIGNIIQKPGYILRQRMIEDQNLQA